MKWQDTYYANNVGAKESPDYEVWKKALLKDDNNDLKKRVERTVRQWNNAVRDILRSETGLRLSHSNETLKVTVQVVDGAPVPLMRFLERHSQYADLLLSRSTIRQTVSGLELMASNFDDCKKLVPEMVCDVVEPYYFASWFKLLDERLDEFRKELRRACAEEDVLGAYFNRKSKIEIYWLSIAIYADMLGVSVEAITVVTLAHELAHAYTHIGFDIDGGQWQTEDFAKTDIYVIEGLAQFYARAVCKKLEHRFPEVIMAFEKLLSELSSPYQEFQGWGQGHQHVGELVRFAMIQTRSFGLTEYDEFLTLLRNAEKPDLHKNRSRGRTASEVVG